MSVSTDTELGTIDPGRLDEEKPPPYWRVLDRLEKTAIGVRRAAGVTTVRRREPAGCLLYGPYWQLPAGAYRLNFHCLSGKPRIASQPVLGVEVIAMNRLQLAWLDLTADELQTEAASLEFSVPAALGLGAGDEARLEFRFFHLGNAHLTITAVDLSGIGSTATAPGSPKLWRMLGRLEKTGIGRRTSDGVAVRRGARQGCVLDGGRPYLQLPTGHYRLGFRCDVARPRMASQPVLGVEVAAWRRWQDDRSRSRKPPLGLQQAWGDFTATELGSGSRSIDFTVPEELSYEGGEEVLFGFRFVHFGNADLTIGAVDLRQVQEHEVPLATPRKWRLLGRLAKGPTGTREGDFVTVRQAERAGRLLYGGRPGLPLPGGRYRLRFRCRAGPPRHLERAVLSVEVVTRARGWRPLFERRSLLRARRDFTAEMLRDETGSVDFNVPAELSREGKEHFCFEFNFRHVGNADLVISAVELHETTGGEERASNRSRAVMPKRTKVVIIGNCQALTVYEALVRTKAFNVRLDAKYHFVGLQKNLHELGRNELESCDSLLVQDIKDWENYPLRAYVRNDCPTIKFPLLHFASLWPFDHYNGPGDKEAWEREWPNLTFLYLDGLLARLRKEIPDREQRLIAYRALSVDGVINYIRLHDFEKRRLIAMDQQFGFDIGRFILDNFQRKRLFYTTNHPNGQIIAMLMQYLLRQLGIDEVCRPVASLDHLNRLQVPVHPKVAKALEVQWAGENTRYRYGGEEITWETYVRRYIDHYG